MPTTAIISLDAERARRRMCAAGRGALIRATDDQPKSQAMRDARRGLRRPFNGLVRLYDEIIAKDVTGRATNELRAVVLKLLAWIDERERHHWPERWNRAA